MNTDRCQAKIPTYNPYGDWFNPKCGKCQSGKWQNVITADNIGEVHYFEHESGHVADVKYFP
jgi:hypothetical protein